MSTFPSTHSSSNLILRLVSILSYILAECYFAPRNNGRLRHVIVIPYIYIYKLYSLHKFTSLDSAAAIQCICMV